MVDIADAAQKSEDSPLLKEEAILPPPPPPPDDIMNAVLDASSPEGQKTTQTTAPSTTSPIIQPPTDSDSSTPPPKKHRSSRTGVIVATLLFLLFLLPLTVYFVSQQQQLVELRGRAVGPYPSVSPTPSGGCSGPLQSCESQPCCSGQNLVCQGVSGSRQCEQTGPGGGGDAFCKSDPGNPGLGCNRYRGHKCANLTNGQCLENGQSFSSWDGAVAYSQGCGQADVACNEGAKDGQLCGDFAIFSDTCGPGTGFTPTQPPGSSPTPGGENTPTPTTPPSGGQCDTIRVYDETDTEITSELRNGTRTLSVGETVTLATSKGSATKARFRIQGITQFAENNPSLTTGNEYRIQIQIPSTITQTQGSFEAEVFIGGNWK